MASICRILQQVERASLGPRWLEVLRGAVGSVEEECCCQVGWQGRRGLAPLEGCFNVQRSRISEWLWAPAELSLVFAW